MTIYLDNNATTRVDPRVAEAMRPFWTERYGNASSLHGVGRDAEDAVARARDEVAGAIGGRRDEIIFTSGGTESDNLALFGVIDAAPAPTTDDPPHVIISAIEHPAVSEAAAALGKRGIDVTSVAVGAEGVVEPARIADALRPTTRLVSLMLANNETGAIQPVAEAAHLAREAGAVVHTDAVQALGKIPVDVGALGVDLMTLSAHKIHGPKGVGALWIRRGVRVAPQIFGGHHQGGIRPGTLAVPLIVGLGAAARLAAEELPLRAAHMTALTDRLLASIESTVDRAALNGPRQGRTPTTVNVEIPGVSGEAMLIQLDQEGIAISTGSACASGSALPSPVLIAMGRSRRRAQSSLRISVSAETTDDDIDRFLEALARCVERQRSMRPRRRS